MRKRNIVYYVLAFILSIVLLLSGCKSEVREPKSDVVKNEDNAEGKAVEKVEEKTPLRLFTIGDESQAYVSGFQLNHPETELEVIHVDLTALRQKSPDQNITYLDAIEHYTYKYGYPDVIIWEDTGNQQTNLPFWVENNIAQDMEWLMADDNNFEETAYYPGVSTIGEINDTLYALPLTLTAEYWTIREDVWVDSTFSQLGENYTAKELLDCLEAQLETEVALQEEGWVVMPMGYSDMSDVYNWLQMFGALQITPEGIELDKDLYAQICRIQALLTENETIYHELTGFSPMQDPTVFNSEYIITSWSESKNIMTHAPQLGLLHAQALNHKVFGQDTRVLWLPYKTENNNSEYAAEVVCWGMIGKESNRAQEAYELIRQLMDTIPAVSFDQWGICTVPTIPLPVNRSAALEMIDAMETGWVQSFSYRSNNMTQSIAKEPLDTNLRESMEQFLSNITLLYVPNYTADQEVFWFLSTYQMSGGRSFETYYETVLEIIEEHQ